MTGADPVTEQQAVEADEITKLVIAKHFPHLEHIVWTVGENAELKEKLSAVVRDVLVLAQSGRQGTKD